MKPKLSDVAKFAGVSLATADRVINKRSGVREATREKVMEAVTKLGYEPDPVAVRLARSGKKIIALVVPSGGSRLTKSIERCLAEIQKNSDHTRVQLRMVIYDITCPQSLSDHLNQIHQDVDGILLAAPDTLETRQSVAAVIEKGVPVYSIFSRLQDGSVKRYIGYDHYKIGRTAMHLLNILTNGKIGKILTHSTFQQMTAYQDRLEGQTAYLNDQQSRCELVQLPRKYDSKDQARILVDYLDQNQDVIALACLGYETRELASYIARNTQKYGHLKIVAVTMDMQKCIIDALLQEHIDAILYLDASRVAKCALSILIEDLEKNNDQDDEAQQTSSHILDFNIFLKDNLPQWALALSKEQEQEDA
ncbi:MAG: substrate-binding domain-containing protein [Cohaesibacter sp.]|nr:substrate-binding domain-containing protein [Cohaesibacter sp.]MCV6603020.1 substrate-binding domain-containing protein [Cohaesibacter sp.]